MRSEFRQRAQGDLACACRSCLRDDLGYLLDVERGIGFDKEGEILPRGEELQQGRAYVRERHVLLTDAVGWATAGGAC